MQILKATKFIHSHRNLEIKKASGMTFLIQEHIFSLQIGHFHDGVILL